MRIHKICRGICDDVCYGHCRDSPIQLTINMSTGLVIIDCITSCIAFSACRNRGPIGKDLK